MHFYCSQLGFKCSLSKKRYKITIDKKADEVLPESATSGIVTATKTEKITFNIRNSIYHDFLSVSKG